MAGETGGELDDLIIEKERKRCAPVLEVVREPDEPVHVTPQSSAGLLVRFVDHADITAERADRLRATAERLHVQIDSGLRHILSELVNDMAEMIDEPDFVAFDRHPVLFCHAGFPEHPAPLGSN